MRRTSFVLAWVFIAAVTVFDVVFAWVNLTTFKEWELNPFALLLSRALGEQAPLWFRGGSVVFGFVAISFARPLFRAAATALVVAAHVALLFAYLVV